MFDVQKAVGFMFPVSGMSTQRTAAILAENWSGTIFSKRVWKNTEATARIVSTALHEMVMAGKTSRETYSAVIDHAVLGGKYAANRLLRTEYNFVSGQAELLSYEDAGVEKYRYVAVLDGRTSEICRELDGKVFPVKDRRVGVNMHPMHPWCRSSTEPVLSSDTRALEKRWARDPVTGEEMKVPADMTYREWEKKQAELRLQRADKRANIELAIKKDEKRQAEILTRIRSAETPKNINSEKQARHIKGADGYKEGRSYIYGDESSAQKLVDQYSGKGIPNFSKKGVWKNTELVILDLDIGVDVKKDGAEIVTNSFKIHYSKTGVHIVPTRRW
jgi:SPP1 gp7 family putative phage head morphogenesis protein